MKSQEPIVTYGEDNSVGKEMLRRYYRSISRVCQCCRVLYAPNEGNEYECNECLQDPEARTSFSGFVFGPD